MRKRFLVMLMLVLSIVCIGCGKKDNVQKQEVPNNDVVENIEEVKNDSIEIIENEDKIVINMFDDSTTEYILSGDVVVERREIFHFDSEDKAQAFAASLSGDRVMRKGNDVIIESPDEEKLNLTKKDLLETYEMLKDEYENE